MTDKIQTTTEDEMVTVTNHFFKDKKGDAFRQLRTEDGRIFATEKLDYWPFFQLGELA